MNIWGFSRDLCIISRYYIKSFIVSFLLFELFGGIYTLISVKCLDLSSITLTIVIFLFLIIYSYITKSSLFTIVNVP